MAIAAAVLTLGTFKAAGAEPAQYQEADDDNLLIEAFDLTVGQIDDMEIVTSTGERVGQVDGVVTDSSGQVVAIMVETEDKKALVHLDEFTLDGSRLITSITKADIHSLGVTDPDSDVEPGAPAAESLPAEPGNAPSM
jgi:sporulation protein YlmC with PRC-barrel domain